MQTLKQVAKAARFAAMKPQAITERQALDAAIDRVTQCGADDGHAVITLFSHKHRCRLSTHNNAMWLYPPIDSVDEYHSALSIGRQHGHPSGCTWFGTEIATDARGRIWARSFDGVVDDFGNLVEVQ